MDNFLLLFASFCLRMWGFFYQRRLWLCYLSLFVYLLSYRRYLWLQKLQRSVMRQFLFLFSFFFVFRVWTNSLVSSLCVLWTIFLMISVFFLSFFLSWIALYSISWSNFSYDSSTMSFTPRLYRSFGVDKFFERLFLLVYLIGEWISLLEGSKFLSRLLLIFRMMTSSYLIFC